jgi:hypothetical protein
MVNLEKIKMCERRHQIKSESHYLTKDGFALLRPPVRAADEVEVVYPFNHYVVDSVCRHQTKL